MAVKAGYLFHQSSRLSDQTATIYAVLASLVRQLARHLSRPANVNPIVAGGPPF